MPPKRLLGRTLRQETACQAWRVKENKDKRDRKIFDLWLACHTQEEIAKAVGCDQKTATNQIEDLRNSVLQNQIPKLASEHATDFDPPIYNVWKQQEKTKGNGMP
jgi:hypothetical protein